METESGDDVTEVPKKVLKLKFNVSYNAVREVIFCEHKTSNPSPEKPLGRTIFLSKIPPWVTEDALKRIFFCKWSYYTNLSIQEIIFKFNS